MRLIVAGSRSFNNYKLLKTTLDILLKDRKPIIISGTCKGGDLMGEKYAIENNLQIEQFPADWDKHGKGAGYIRNKEMAKASTHCICFWDGKSKGTKHMIDIAKENKLPLRVVWY